MRNMLTACLLSVLIFGCRDEINIPESSSYVDGEAPMFNLITPQKNQVFVNQINIPIQIECTDDYELKYFKFELYPETPGYDTIRFETQLSDTAAYTYNANYTVPTTDSTTYEVYIEASDLVGNVDNEVYFITTK